MKHKIIFTIYLLSLATFFVSCGGKFTPMLKENSQKESQVPAGELSTGQSLGKACAHTSSVSDGQGGRVGEYLQYTDWQGLSSQYHLYTPSSAYGAMGLLIYLHGDEDESFLYPKDNIYQMAQVASVYNMMTVAIYVPDRATRSWWRKSDQNKKYLRSFIENVVYKGFKVDKARVLLVGFSGGSDFLSGTFIPQEWDLFCGGGGILFAGGYPDFSVTNFHSQFIKNFKMHFYTGAEDNGRNVCSPDYDALSSAREGAQSYMRAGLGVTVEYPQGIDHCNVDEVSVIKRMLSQGFLKKTMK